MQFPVISDEQMALSKMKLKEGMAEFEVIDAEETVAKSGNPMIKIKLNVWDIERNQGTLFDYLVGIDKMAWKIKAFCKAMGHPEQYEAGEINPLFLKGKTGKCILKLRKQEGYEPSMQVKEYVLVEELTSKDEFTDDKIPF